MQVQHKCIIESVELMQCVSMLYLQPVVLCSKCAKGELNSTGIAKHYVCPEQTVVSF